MSELNSANALAGRPENPRKRMLRDLSNAAGGGPGNQLGPSLPCACRLVSGSSGMNAVPPRRSNGCAEAATGTASSAPMAAARNHFTVMHPPEDQPADPRRRVWRSGEDYALSSTNTTRCS